MRPVLSKGVGREGCRDEVGNAAQEMPAIYAVLFKHGLVRSVVLSTALVSGGFLAGPFNATLDVTICKERFARSRPYKCRQYASTQTMLLHGL